jgi:hypothetical protein
MFTLVVVDIPDTRVARLSAARMLGALSDRHQVLVVTSGTAVRHGGPARLAA